MSSELHSGDDTRGTPLAPGRHLIQNTIEHTFIFHTTDYAADIGRCAAETMIPRVFDRGWRRDLTRHRSSRTRRPTISPGSFVRARPSLAVACCPHSCHTLLSTQQVDIFDLYRARTDSNDNLSSLTNKKPVMPRVMSSPMKPDDRFSFLTRSPTTSCTTSSSPGVDPEYPVPRTTVDDILLVPHNDVLTANVPDRPITTLGRSLFP